MAVGGVILLCFLFAYVQVFAQQKSDGSIFVAAYWPVFTSSQLVRFDYKSADGSLAPFTSVFSYDQGSASMLYNNYDSSLNWLNRWYYQYRPGFGIAEYRDDYPNNKKVVMAPPIGWGEYASIGAWYENYPQFDTLKCSPPASGSGVQLVLFEEHLSSIEIRNVTFQDVLVFSYSQSWNSKAPTGARYWMALGVGPIAVQFILNNVTSARADAVISHATQLP